MTSGELVGAELLIIKDRRTAFHEAYGWSDREEGIPVERNSIWSIKSMSKPFTATAILMLAEEGALSLDDPVRRYIPGFAGNELTTVRHLHKAIAAQSWQFTVTQFADVVFEGPKQVVRGSLTAPYPHLICVMVQIAPADSQRRDRFYVLPWETLANIVTEGHREFLAKHGGIRPRQPKSLHTAVKPAALARWENRWDVLEEACQAG